jgi:AraC-like DNA-binding protein
MRLAVYDLVGALFAPNDPVPSRHAVKLFARVRSVIKDGFADPDFGPCEAAARAGISLRYLQKMFTQRGSTCSEFIYSFRLDRAARLLRRRAALDASQALSEIAYASGFRDYKHFARKFRHRFGHGPGRAHQKIVSPFVTGTPIIGLPCFNGLRRRSVRGRVRTDSAQDWGNRSKIDHGRLQHPSVRAEQFGLVVRWLRPALCVRGTFGYRITRHAASS